MLSSLTLSFLIACVIPCICQGLFVSEDTYSCQEPAYHLERSDFKYLVRMKITKTGPPEGQFEKKEQLVIHMARAFGKKRDSISAATVDVHLL